MGFNSGFKGLIDKLSHSYMFRRYCIILRELGTTYELPENDTIVSKHVGV